MLMDGSVRFSKATVTRKKARQAKSGPQRTGVKKGPFLMQPAAGGMHIELLIIGQLTLRHTAEIVREASC